MDPVTAIGAAQTSIKALMDVARGAMAATVDHQVKDKLIEIQTAILDAQQKLGDAQGERLSLLHELAETKQRLLAFETAKAALDAYELHEIDSGRFLYRAKNHSVAHYACPTCHNGGKVSILQHVRGGEKRIIYTCTTCKFKFGVGPSDPPIDSRVPRASSWARDW